ncbi:MAG: glutamine--fructose-6-phosphate transaminase (isomerizing) [Candidatus Lloydbacteria bacterium RIFCSPHIGHO2_02_FULL_51_22]|uniref:Glutamine--fructose-6-phosphate aminotransferase [isomerizing] n=3 Tax=Candidatus Lloydiibacteriota TaxID=1817910 RepID=A0A1G2DDW1_9BACT|nr:MAG: glutamine--fructose-6-phosphate transaminase (isomerizing) [Candidatus Lloydbacteria bacterium RIFCSPHIGHO2_02_FULL_51_22]OGZ15682.1 MAG: glutamine--fructose-6-phosphate transaminase (isomerizing) [Candidatus Lloydbacteria bacterium RIFCSPLOWO2_02_FULL_51_11]OGZ15928.1 MAG: glutamine--fructose-6-phosphate transaminase (isomerizing) [Candidatus Lloydbacteria bacterium RIFCSPLOWO2_12_FULL_51_9]
MCGIFSYRGEKEQNALVVLKGLRDLEYRGYDSWGFAVRNGDGTIVCKKAVGKISEAREEDFARLFGISAIGHTRWATHGGVSEKNTHPHLSADGSIAVVHNGIIENYEVLKAELIKKYGARLFRSETDTEVIPHLIADAVSGGATFEKACSVVSKRLTGRFAFIALHGKTGALFAVRDGSPLVLGNGGESWYAASDIPALLDYTTKIYFLENGESAMLSPGASAVFQNFRTGKKIAKRATTLTLTKQSASKEGHAHYMLKEILDQKETLSATLSVSKKEIARAVRELRAAKKIFMTGCGTAGHMCMGGEYFFIAHAGRTAPFAASSEFGKLLPFVDRESVVIAVTQSGETADLLEAIKGAKVRGAKIISLVNVRNSSVERESDITLPIQVGVEKAVASTKAATSQLLLLILLAYAVGGKETAARRLLGDAAHGVSAWLTTALFKKIKRAARRFITREHVYVIGKSLYFPVALEAALKIKEVSYMHAEGLASGELKHGTLALIEKGTPCMVFVANDAHTHDVLGSVSELKARGAFLIGVSPEKHPSFDEWIKVPDLKDASPLTHMIAAQIFAYYLSVGRGHNPDMPRNLAKSVTVK